MGAGVNLVVFALAAWLARSAPILSTSDRAPRAVRVAEGFWVLPAIALSGAVSFTYEVLWTRLLGHDPSFR